MLLIVDMQTGFGIATRTVNAVVEQIKLAKKQRKLIINLTFDACGPVYPELSKAFGQYGKVATRTKDCQDGSDVIIDLIPEKYKSTIKVCGAYTNQCVYDTFTGLANKRPLAKIKIINKACFMPYSDYADQLDLLEILIDGYKNVSII